VTVIRLSGRSELWWPEDLDSLRKAQRIVLVTPDDRLLAELSKLEIATSVLPVEVREGDLLVIPMTPMEELVLLTNRLIGPGGCPWDIEQTHESLKRYLLEEAYEVLDAIDSKDPAKLREELGDLILQPVLHAAKAQTFSLDDVATGIVDKLIRRHPHVFGDVDASDTETVLRNWDRIKQSEKGEAAPASALEGVPRGMASLLRAFEVSKRAARNGFEWPDLEAVWDKLHEEEAELRAARTPEEIESEVGDLLFTAVNIARWVKVEPEEALRKMLNRFTMRFQAMEAASDKPLSELRPEEWDLLWNQAKSLTKNA
jgi:tetrapyrrole methylase family protein / MazG family protein